MTSSTGSRSSKWTSPIGICLSSFSVIVVTLLVSNLSPVVSASNYSSSLCPSAFWNFGDSLTDTGGTLNTFPLCPQCDPERSPYGQSFFGKPAKRWCNGRVVPDWFALAFNKPLLQPYVQAGAFDFTYGTNFAQGGATASNSTIKNPFFLAFQVSQFLRLKETTTPEAEQHFCKPFLPFLPREDSYTNGLYTFEIGGLDVINSLLLENKTVANITTQVILEAMTNIANAIKALYSSGGRKFLFFNSPNGGCATIVATLLGAVVPTDALGCVPIVGLLNQAFNAALNTTIATARQQYPDATFTIFNYYAANEEILLNPAKYGFNPNLTLTACCGAPGIGAYNYNPLVTCGNAGSNVCSNPDEHINWDGVHFTEAFYRVIAKFVLNGQFTDTGFNYTANCNLSFKNFGSDVTFDSVYKNTCKVTF